MECNHQSCPAYRLAADNKERIESLEQRDLIKVDKLARIETTVDNVVSDVTAILSIVQEIKEKPAKRWEGLMGALIGAGAMLFVEYLISGGA